MCTKEEVKKIVDQSRDEILERVDISINKRINHSKPSEETKELINEMRESCHFKSSASNTTQELMKKDIEDILKEIQADKLWKQAFERKIEKTYAKKAELDHLRESQEKTEVTVEKLKKFMWQLTAVVAFIIMLWRDFGHHLVDAITKN